MEQQTQTDDKKQGSETVPEKQPKPVHEGKALTQSGINSLVPRNFAEAERVALALAKSDLVPKEMIGKPANILLAIMFGAEIDLSPAQALQNIMVVNGRPCLWGDAVMGKVEASGLQEWWKDEYDPKLDGGTHKFITKRKGRDPMTRTFSMADAKLAGLDKKPGPWQQYTRRMLFHRARSWALRDTYPDVLKGIHYYEEERDVIALEKASDGRESYYAMPQRTAAPAATQPAGEQAPQQAAGANGGGVATAQSEPGTQTAAVEQASSASAQDQPELATLPAGTFNVQRIKGGGGYRIVAKDDTLYFSEEQSVEALAIQAQKAGQGLDVEYWRGIAQNDIVAVRLHEPQQQQKK